MGSGVVAGFRGVTVRDNRNVIRTRVTEAVGGSTGQLFSLMIGFTSAALKSRKHFTQTVTLAKLSRWD